MRRPAIAAALLCLGTTVAAQTSGPMTIQGTVIDAGTAAPIAGATLVLVARDAAVVLPALRDGTPQLTTSRTAKTHADGGYSFTDVANGQYQLHVHRLGYEATTIAIDLTDAGAVSRVSIGLVEMPVPLRPQHIRSDSTDRFGRFVTMAGVDSGWRAATAMARQREFLSSDVREMTNADALDAGSAGETDVLAAFRHVPGVTIPGATSDALYIRGARWSQVGVNYDGLPLLEARHDGSAIFSAVSPDAIGGAFLHPGVRPASLLGEGASLIDLHSRRARADSSFSGSLGLLVPDGGSLSFDTRTDDGGAGLMVSARRNMADFGFLHPLSNHQGNHYSEVASRGDLRLSDNTTLDLSALWSQDFSNSVYTAPAFGHAGTSLAKATLNTSLAQWSLSQSVGVSVYDMGGVASHFVFDSNSFVGRVDKEVGDASRASALIISGQGRRIDSAGGAWGLGYDVMLESARFQVPTYVLSVYDTASRTHQESSQMPTLSPWIEGRFRPAKQLTVDAGLRSYVALASASQPVRIAPSILASYSLSPSTRATAGIGRSFQDFQLLGAVPGGDLWRVTGSTAAPMVADQIGAGVEQWRGESYVFAINGYGRLMRNTIFTPLPADTTEAKESTLDRMTNASVRAWGAEASVRKLSGVVTGSMSYSIGRSTVRWDGQSASSPAERTSALDALIAVRHDNKRYGFNLIEMAGLPFAVYDPVTAGNVTFAVADTTEKQIYGPTSAGLVAFYEWTSHVRRVAITPYFSFGAVIGRSSESIYYGQCSSQRVAHDGSVCYNNDLIGRTSFSGAGLGTGAGLRLVF